MNCHKKLLPALLMCMVATGVWAQADEPTDSQPQAPDAVQIPGDKYLLAQPTEDSTQAPETDTGRLAIQAVQGTPGGPDIRDAEVEVILYHQKIAVKTINTTLDEFGVVVIEDLPVSQGVTPVVRIKHAGMTYQEVGTLMGPAQPIQKIEVTVYEVTETPPPWSVAIRQVMLTRAPEGLKVTEVVVNENPTKETWLGTPQDQGDPVTTGVTIPETAEQLTLGTGFHDWCCTTLDGGVLVNHLPMMPHITEMNFSYIVPAEDGSASLSFAAPAVVSQMIVIVPNDIGVDNFSGIELGGNSKIADTMVRYYTADKLAPGQAVTMTVSNLSSVSPTASPSESSAESSAAKPAEKPDRTPVLEQKSSKFGDMVMAVGGAIFMVAAVIVVFIMARPTSQE